MNPEKLLDESTHWRSTERVGPGAAIRSFDVLWAWRCAQDREPEWTEQLAAAWERWRSRRLARMEAG
jgi:hypothetical protein